MSGGRDGCNLTTDLERWGKVDSQSGPSAPPKPQRVYPNRRNSLLFLGVHHNLLGWGGGGVGDGDIGVVVGTLEVVGRGDGLGTDPEYREITHIHTFDINI